HEHKERQERQRVPAGLQQGRHASGQHPCQACDADPLECEQPVPARACRDGQHHDDESHRPQPPQVACPALTPRSHDHDPDRTPRTSVCESRTSSIFDFHLRVDAMPRVDPWVETTFSIRAPKTATPFFATLKWSSSDYVMEET